MTRPRSITATSIELYRRSPRTPARPMTARFEFVLGLAALVVVGLALTVLYLRTVLAERGAENVTGVAPT